jgi:phthiocerol/phenolphthiocerol synthesis type-I polyketide synthase E
MRCPRPFYVVPFPVEQRDQIPSLRALAERFRHSVAQVQPRGPCTLAGYSFGGNVAFEVALQLQRGGRPVTELVMFDAHPPEAYVGGRTSERDVLAAFPLLLSSLFGTGKQPQRLNSEPPRSIEDLLASSDLRGSSLAVLGEYRRFFQIWRHNHQALKSYYPDDQLRGRLTMFEASDREDRRVLDLLRIRSLDKAPWRDHVHGPVRMTRVAGDHYSMFVKPENLAALAATWDRVLAGAEGSELWLEPPLLSTCA